MKPDPKSDAAAVLRAMEAIESRDALDLAKRIGWVAPGPGMVAMQDARTGEDVDVRIGRVYDADRAFTAICALVEMGAIER